MYRNDQRKSQIYQLLKPPTNKAYGLFTLIVDYGKKQSQLQFRLFKLKTYFPEHLDAHLHRLLIIEDVFILLDLFKGWIYAPCRSEGAVKGDVLAF